MPLGCNCPGWLPYQSTTPPRASSKSIKAFTTQRRCCPERAAAAGGCRASSRLSALRAGAVAATGVNCRTRKLASTNIRLVTRMTANASPGNKGQRQTPLLRYFKSQNYRDQSSGHRPRKSIRGGLDRNYPPGPAAGMNGQPTRQKQRSQRARHEQGMLAKNAELRHRADQHEKESTHQKRKLGVKCKQSLLRLRHLCDRQRQPRDRDRHRENSTGSGQSPAPRSARWLRAPPSLRTGRTVASSQ